MNNFTKSCHVKSDIVKYGKSFIQRREAPGKKFAVVIFATNDLNQIKVGKSIEYRSR